MWMKNCPPRLFTGHRGASRAGGDGHADHSGGAAYFVGFHSCASRCASARPRALSRKRLGAMKMIATGVRPLDVRQCSGTLT